jgi:hypothetical protein
LNTACLNSVNVTCTHPPCSVVEFIGKCKVQNSKSGNFVTVVNRTHNTTFSTQYKVRNLNVKL